MIFDGTTEERSYWKAGSGDPFTGGCIGYDSVWRNSDGQIVFSAGGRPPGAVDIAEAEYDTLLADCITEGEQIITDGNVWLAQQKADQDVTLASARAKLIAGTPLTAEEAALLTGGL